MENEKNINIEEILKQLKAALEVENAEEMKQEELQIRMREIIERQTPMEVVDNCMVKECPRCGHIDVEGDRYCGRCGQKLSWDNVEKQVIADKWIPCSEKLPPEETKVMVLTERIRKDSFGRERVVREATFAIYESGNCTIGESLYVWKNAYLKFDESKGCSYVQSGWYEIATARDCFDNVMEIKAKVIAWALVRETIRGGRRDEVD